MNMTFKFEIIPVAELEKKKLQPDQSPTATVVLVVDDDPGIADSIVLILTQWGYAAEAAYDTKTALEMALLVPPELLLINVAMPGTGGIELAVAVQKAVPDCRVLLLSGQSATGDPSTISRNLGTDGFHVLAKPINPNHLLAEISRLLGQS
jgi:DNA-binding response OmpR family regulator